MVVVRRATAKSIFIYSEIQQKKFILARDHRIHATLRSNRIARWRWVPKTGILQDEIRCGKIFMTGSYIQWWPQDTKFCGPNACKDISHGCVTFGNKRAGSKVSLRLPISSACIIQPYILQGLRGLTPTEDYINTPADEGNNEP